MAPDEENQQQAQTTPVPVDNALPHNHSSSTTTVEAVSPVTSSSNGSKDDNSTPPASTSPSTGNSSLPADKQGEKRKEPVDEADTGASSNTPNKRVKVSEAIVDCEVALEVLNGINTSTKKFPNNGKVLAWALPPDDPDFLRIHDYVNNSQSPAMPIKVLSILRIVTAADKLKDDTSLNFNNHPNAADMHRMMLWHGTPRRNVLSILENGFRAPYPGAGIFFADRIGKSIVYCRDYRRNSAGYLFLTDVLIGRKGSWTNKSTVGNIICRSGKIDGDIIPDKDLDVESDGCVWPLGRNRNLGFFSWLFGPAFAYNEYIVYNAAQAQPKFLVKVQFC